MIDDPDEVWRQLCPEAVECFSFEVRVGAVFGLVVRGGERIALKIHRSAPTARLVAQQEVQEHLWLHGFPCPRPLGVRGHATLEQWLDDGAYRDAHEPEGRRLLAEQLVRLIRMTRGVRPSTDLPPFFPRPGGPLWPEPHDVRIDFEATAAGAEWIDDLARAARAQRDRGGGDVALGHHDWTSAHVRFRELGATAVYDWDSLSTGPEPFYVGEAASHFTFNDHLPVEPWPSVDETILFIDDYERARTSPFTREEQATAAAAAAYARAYTTRCFHALGLDTSALNLPEYVAALLQ